MDGSVCPVVFIWCATWKSLLIPWIRTAVFSRTGIGPLLFSDFCRNIQREYKWFAHQTTFQTEVDSCNSERDRRHQCCTWIICIASGPAHKDWWGVFFWVFVRYIPKCQCSSCDMSQTHIHLFSYDFQLESKTDFAILSRLTAMLVRINWDNGQCSLSTYSNVGVHVR